MRIQRQLISIPFITLALAGVVQADWSVEDEPAYDFEQLMLAAGFTKEQIAENLKAKGYDWQDDKGNWAVTPAPEKYVPDVPDWVERDYRDLTFSSRSRAVICWDDRPISKGCYGDKIGYTWKTCYRRYLNSKELARDKKYYDNICRNLDWDAYWVEYKKRQDAGRK